MDANGSLDRFYDLRGYTERVIVTTHKQRMWPHFVCQVLDPSESYLLSVQPSFSSAQLASIFIHDLLTFSSSLGDQPSFPGARGCPPVSTKRLAIPQTPQNLHRILRRPP